MSYNIYNEELRDSLKWLINLRWIGLIGVFCATHVIRDVAFLSVPLIPVYVVLGLSSLYNLYFKRMPGFPKQDAKRLTVGRNRLAAAGAHVK